jgi:hypothetical protein
LDKAYCTLNNTLYGAEEFSELPENLLLKYRKQLQCPDCKQKAYFRIAHSGMDAVFGANPHTPECGERRTDPNKIKAVLKPLEAYLAEGTRTLMLNLGGPSISDTIACETSSQLKQSTVKRSRPLSAGTTQARNDWHLDDLLAALVRVPALAVSKQVVEATGVIESQSLSDLLVHTLTLTPRHHNATKGFWGTVVNVNAARNGALWLNSGHWGMGNKLDICIPPELVKTFEARYSIKRMNDLRGAHVLIIGTAIGPSVDFKVSLEDLNHIAVLMPMDTR